MSHILKKLRSIILLIDEVRIIQSIQGCFFLSCVTGEEVFVWLFPKKRTTRNAGRFTHWRNEMWSGNDHRFFGTLGGMDLIHRKERKTKLLQGTWYLVHVYRYTLPCTGTYEVYIYNELCISYFMYYQVYILEIVNGETAKKRNNEKTKKRRGKRHKKKSKGSKVLWEGLPKIVSWQFRAEKGWNVGGYAEHVLRSGRRCKYVHNVYILGRHCCCACCINGPIYCLRNRWVDKHGVVLFRAQTYDMMISYHDTFRSRFIGACPVPTHCIVVAMS